MATVKIDRFGGVAPRIHPTLLADGAAVAAHNCRLKSGKLVPLRQPRIASGRTIRLEGGLSGPAGAKSMHVWRRTGGDFDFLLFPGVTWAAPGNIADDALSRMVVSGDMDGDGAADPPVVYIRDGASVVAHPLAKERLEAPRVKRADDAPALDDNRRYTYFYFSWVDKYGYESPPSDPSKVWVADADGGGEWVDGDIEYMDGDEIVFEKPQIPDGLAILRIYKVITGTEEGRNQYVAEYTRSALDGIADGGTFSVAKRDDEAGEIMPEVEAPPDDLACIHAVPGAYYAGFSPSKPRTVRFSEVDLLYSWPDAYAYDVGDDLVALAVTTNTVFALTNGWPYVLSGTAPESMTVAKLAGPAACVSPRGVCVWRNAVYFASNAGLMTIYNDADAGTVCANLTEKIFTKDQWLAFGPETCMMAQWDGALHLFFDGEARGLVIDLADGSPVVTTHDEAARCVCIDDASDKPYFVRRG